MNDSVFGTLTFEVGWTKKLQIPFWNNSEVKIVVSSYEDEKPNELQQDAYKRFIEDVDQISRLTYKKLKNYLSIIEDDIVLFLGIESLPDDINQIVNINHVLFLESGSFAVVCDAKWDDHGVAVLCKETEVIAGPQDIIWQDDE